MNEKIGPALAARLGDLGEHERVRVDIFLEGEPGRVAGAPWAGGAEKGYREAVVASIKDSVRAWQSELGSYLRSEAHTPVGPAGDPIDGPEAEPPRILDTHWINNSVTAEVSSATVHELLDRPDVRHIELVRQIPLEDLLDAAGATLPRPPRAASGPGGSGQAPAPPTRSVQQVKAPALWKLGLTGDGVLVAVIDTGVNHGHPDLANRMWDGGATGAPLGRNFVDGNADPMDHDGHGTACAGIVAGDGTSGSATGVAPGARVMALRAESEQGIMDAMQFAIDNGADVISMSMSWPSRRQPNYISWRRMSEVIFAAGVLHANSIGNDGDREATDAVPFNIGAPGNCPPPWLNPLQKARGGLASAIACGACNDEDELHSQSGRGPAGWGSSPFTDYPYALPAQEGLLKPDVCAPGPDTVTCNSLFGVAPGAGPYLDLGGTSAATPHVAGCIALLVQACIRSGNPVLAERILEAIETTAVPLKGQQDTKENHCGAGRIDVAAAFEFGKHDDRKWWA
jgi:subtilisin family serine protease